MKKVSKFLTIIVITSAIICVLVVIVGITKHSDGTSSENVNVNSPMTITAYAAEGINYLKFEHINAIGEGDLCVYRETTTDVMYINDSGVGGGVTVMLDPQTGGPLTYTNWLNNYANK